jgi:serine/threonine protein kinase
VLALFDQMLDALAYLHAQAIYHRDIKPANILVTAEGRPVLIDFGAARQRLGEKSLTVVESAGYTPFEQLQSRGNIGPWSDLYALGATVYKLLTREAPPKAMDRMPEDSYQTLTGREDLLGLYGPEILGSIDRALAVRVADRWQSAEEWRSALAGNPVQVTREGLSYSPPPLPPPLPAVTPPPPPQYGFPAGPPPLPSSTGDAKKENPLAVGWQFVRNELGQARQPLPNRAESICSVILPGLGQLVQGRVATGIGHFFAALFVWGITIGFGGWVVHLWSCGEASLWPGRPPVGGA